MLLIACLHSNSLLRHLLAHDMICLYPQTLVAGVETPFCGPVIHFVSMVKHLAFLHDLLLREDALIDLWSSHAKPLLVFFLFFLFILFHLVFLIGRTSTAVQVDSSLQSCLHLSIASAMVPPSMVSWLITGGLPRFRPGTCSRQQPFMACHGCGVGAGVGAAVGAAVGAGVQSGASMRAFKAQAVAAQPPPTTLNCRSHRRQTSKQPMHVSTYNATTKTNVT